MNYLTSRLMGCGIFLAIAVCIGIGMVVYEGVVSNMHAKYAAPFKPQMAAYFAAPTNTAATGGPVNGKMIVLTPAGQDFDWDVSYELPADLKAANPAEVGTVVWLVYGRVPGNLLYGQQHLPSYVQTCSITVIDQASRIVLAKAQLQGGPPPSSIHDTDREGVGAKPTQEVVAYLKGLPRSHSTAK